MLSKILYTYQNHKTISKILHKKSIEAGKSIVSSKLNIIIGGWQKDLNSYVKIELPVTSTVKAVSCWPLTVPVICTLIIRSSNHSECGRLMF